ncbi:MAG TPA: 23S rRNA (adenine(2503)-C(2))-methyltransferase RlmN, partial [Firmicutes bacterium]|nr:23S rRNA (adenine(2503)-C(2))-methyltransferase RlmN [Bacillota bacterium]
LSTCGLTEKFDKLAALNLQLTLSVSLHAPDDDTRNMLMPVNRKRGVAELYSACDRYFEKTGRRISFEYAMIDGVNDTPEHARMLAENIRKIGGHVNLIPLNHVDERRFEPSKPENMKKFIDILQKSGVNVTVRRKLGGDVDASCGQLRRKMAHSES